MRGAARFADCAACHRLEAGANNVGPSLHGIFSRKAGEIADFRYSPAMKRSGIVWTPETLEKFITRSASHGAGQPYALCRHEHPSDRADLIAFLRRQRNIEGIAIGVGQRESSGRPGWSAPDQAAGCN